MSILNQRWLLGFTGAALMVAFAGCGGSSDGKLPITPSGSGGSASGSGGSASGSGGSASGTGGSASGTGGSASGTGGSASGSGGSGGGSGGASGSGGTTPTDGSVTDATTGNDTGGGADVAPAGWAGIPGIENLMTVKPSPGCGMPPTGTLGQWQQKNITITPKPVRGSGNRVYYVKLPTGYMASKPYRLIVGGSGCNGAGTDVPDFTNVALADGGVIHVSLQIEQGVHVIPTGPNCFDDKRTDSVEYEFLKQALEAVKKTVCYDEHRVFVTGHSSGGWLSNQLGCVFGSTLVRAIAPSSGGLASGAGIAPPCSDLPTPGIWNANTNDTEAPGPTVAAVERALRVNKCTGGTSVMTAPKAAYMVPGTTTATCEKFTGCPAEFPVVWCHPVGEHEKKPWHEAAAWQFWKSLP